MTNFRETLVKLEDFPGFALPMDENLVIFYPHDKISDYEGIFPFTSQSTSLLPPYILNFIENHSFRGDYAW